jgi:Carbonic anhydrases/acetyltransferases, isoleucine patch superfamily
VCRAEDKDFVPENAYLDGYVNLNDTVEILGLFRAGNGCSLNQGVIIGAYLGAPVVFGDDVTVGPDCIFEEGSVVGDGSEFGVACTVCQYVNIGKNVKFGDGVYVRRGATIDDDTVIGTRSGGTTIGEFSQIRSMSDIQGTLNTIGENGEIQLIDMVEVGGIIPSSNIIDVVNGKMWSASLA